MKSLIGKSLFEGIAEGILQVSVNRILKSDFVSIEVEKEKFSYARENLLGYLTHIINSDKLNKEQKSILNISLATLSDSFFINTVSEFIEKGNSAIHSLNLILKSSWLYEKSDKFLADAYFNLSDVVNQLIGLIVKNKEENLDNKIIYSDQISTVQLLIYVESGIRIKGIITNKQSKHSHLTTLIKSLEIPALCNVGVDFSMNGKNVILDSRMGYETLIIEPDKATEQEYKIYTSVFKKNRTDLLELNELPSITKDGKRIKISVVLNYLPDPKLENLNYDEIGLVKTEMIFNNKLTATSEEQFVILEKLTQYDKPIGIRLWDLDESKINMKQGSDSFLKGSRHLLSDVDRLRNSINAILRLADKHKIKIIYPFITSVGEIINLNKVLESCKKSINSEVEVSCFIETPASVIMIRDILDLVDSVVIGSSDLTQHTLAIKRDDPLSEDNCDFLDPAILKSINICVNAASEMGKKVILAGEMTLCREGIVAAVLMGVNHIITSPSFVLEAKNTIRRMDLDKLKHLQQYLLTSNTKEYTRSLLKILMQEGNIL